MNSDSITLLKECNSGCKMATDSIEQVRPYVNCENLAKLIANYDKKHIEIGDKCHKLLEQNGEKEKDPSMMVKAFARMETEMKLLMEKDSHEIAKILIDGCNMGIKSLSENLNKYTKAEGDVISLLRELIKLEQDLSDDLLEYL